MAYYEDKLGNSDYGNDFIILEEAKPHRNWFQLTLDQKIEKWEDDGFRSKPVAQFCYKIADVTTVKERDRLHK
jgi:hypothetical protein